MLSVSSQDGLSLTQPACCCLAGFWMTIRKHGRSGACRHATAKTHRTAAWIDALICRSRRTGFGECRPSSPLAPGRAGKTADETVGDLGWPFCGGSVLTCTEFAACFWGFPALGVTRPSSVIPSGPRRLQTVQQSNPPPAGAGQAMRLVPQYFKGRGQSCPDPQAAGPIATAPEMTSPVSAGSGGQPRHSPIRWMESATTLRALSSLRHHAARQRGALFKTRDIHEIVSFATTLTSSVVAEIREVVLTTVARRPRTTHRGRAFLTSRKQTSLATANRPAPPTASALAAARS